MTRIIMSKNYKRRTIKVSKEKNKQDMKKIKLKKKKKTKRKKRKRNQTPDPSMESGSKRIQSHTRGIHTSTLHLNTFKHVLKLFSYLYRLDTTFKSFNRVLDPPSIKVTTVKESVGDP